MSMLLYTTCTTTTTTATTTTTTTYSTTITTTILETPCPDWYAPSQQDGQKKADSNDKQYTDHPLHIR